MRWRELKGIVGDDEVGLYPCLKLGEGLHAIASGFNFKAIHLQGGFDGYLT